MGEDDVVQVVLDHARTVNITSGPTVTLDGGGQTKTVTVSATGEIPLLTGLFSFISNTANNTYEVSSKATMRYESGTLNLNNNNDDD